VDDQLAFGDRAWRLIKFCGGRIFEERTIGLGAKATIGLGAKATTGLGAKATIGLGAIAAARTIAARCSRSG
jgi:hypothetical protein